MLLEQSPFIYGWLHHWNGNIFALNSTVTMKPSNQSEKKGRLSKTERIETLRGVAFCISTCMYAAASYLRVPFS